MDQGGVQSGKTSVPDAYIKYLQFYVNEMQLKAFFPSLFLLFCGARRLLMEFLTLSRLKGSTLKMGVFDSGIQLFGNTDYCTQTTELFCSTPILPCSPQEVPIFWTTVPLTVPKLIDTYLILQLEA